MKNSRSQGNLGKWHYSTNSNHHVTDENLKHKFHERSLSVRSPINTQKSGGQKHSRKDIQDQNSLIQINKSLERSNPAVNQSYLKKKIKRDIEDAVMTAINFNDKKSKLNKEDLGQILFHLGTLRQVEKLIASCGDPINNSFLGESVLSEVILSERSIERKRKSKEQRRDQEICCLL